jgi:hypothetical protein
MRDVLKPQWKAAQLIFSENMDKHKFSYSPWSIYKAGFDESGELYKNWETRMKQHQPIPAEHPGLYSQLRFYGASAATRQTTRRARSK